MDRSLKILAWNCNGLLQHQHELQVVLSTKNIDICLISETHFTKQSYVKFKGYETYHALHPDNCGRGGSAIIIKENIYHYKLFKHEHHDIQSVAISVEIQNYPINIAAIYCPPRYSLKQEGYINFFTQLGKRFILGGDFNAKNTYWGSRLTTTKGRELLHALKNFKCDVISTGKPTYWPTDSNKIPDLIDFFIYKNLPENHIYIEDFSDLHSDHSSIMLTLNSHIKNKTNTIHLVNKYTDWDSFKLNLDNSLDLKTPLKTTEQLDKEVQNFIQHIQQSAWENTPEIKRRSNRICYPREILELIAEKRKQRNKWHQSRSPEDKRKLNTLTKKLRRTIKKFNDESINLHLTELSNDRNTEYSLWKATKSLKRPTTQIPPIKEENGTWATKDEEIASRFARHLENIFQPNEGEILNNNKYNNEHIKHNIKPVTPKEVAQEIKINIKPKKAPGYDLITGEVLRNLSSKAILKLTAIINASFRLRYVPNLWKVAEVIMIAKPGKPLHEANSYRPISLLPTMSKVFEKLFLKRLKPILEDNKLIPDHQFGFREKHSTIDQVHRIVNVIETALEEKKICTAVFLDVAQAFDKVWHEGLIFKLRQMLPKQFSDLLESYISNRVFRVRHGEAYSDLKEIKAGVPQGSVLGPVLYLLYTCDIPETENTVTATFADDTAIIALGNSQRESVSKTQYALNKVFNWTKLWRMKLNESKSVHIDFTNKNKNHHPIYINNVQVPYVNTAKYLGMTLDVRLRWKAHVKKKREELELKYKKLHWLLNRNSALSMHNKILIYKQVLMPVWTYGIQLWGCTKQSNVQVIQRFQNKVLREIANAPWYIRNEDLHRDLKVDLVKNVIRKYAEAHQQRLHQHVNVEAIQLLDTTELVRRLKRTKPFDLTI